MAVPPSGESIPINVEPYDMNDEALGDHELREIVAGMRNGRAGGSGGMKAENLKVWLRGKRRSRVMSAQVICGISLSNSSKPSGSVGKSRDRCCGW